MFVAAPYIGMGLCELLGGGDDAVSMVSVYGALPSLAAKPP
jgi:hypothetical protein